MDNKQDNDKQQVNSQQATGEPDELGVIHQNTVSEEAFMGRLIEAIEYACPNNK